jgi:hypothetical protein
MNHVDKTLSNWALTPALADQLRKLPGPAFAYGDTKE